MALPSIQMPATLPDWRIQPHDATLGTPYAAVEFSVGQARRRRVATGTAQKLAAELLLTEAQAATLHTFIEDTLEAAALPFALRTIGPDGARQWWHARFATAPAWQCIATGSGPQWQVSATFRLEGEPSTTAPA